MEYSKQNVDLATAPIPVIDRNAPVTEVATQAEPSTEAPVVAEPVDQQPPIPTVQPVNADVDEYGVPWKNRAMEWKRKSEEVIERLPQIIDEKLSKVTQQPQTPQYTYEQLEAYKLQNSSDPNIVSWATGEQRKMQLAENKKLFEEVTGASNRQREFESSRQQAFEAVKQKYPEAVVVNSPMFNLTKQYMQVPEIANRPDGLFWAAKMAKADLLESQAPALQQKVQQAKADVKQAQKASLTEGSGRRVTISEPPQQVALNTLRKTGSLKDAESAIGSILRSRGILGA